MTLESNEQVREDLNRADAVVRACWSNFIATESTYVLRDLIVVEIAKAREAEREACARISESRAGGSFCGSDRDTGSFDDCEEYAGEQIAALIRARSNN